jgi:DNA helicase HerA-like ATPase
MPKFKQPRSDERTVILGRTGSGKTCAAVWHLSLQDIDKRPWVVIDYKGDELINGITRAESIGFDKVPDEPGIYILRVMPGDEAALSDWFRRVWEHEGIGIYVDEGYMVDPRDRFFNACLTQGRSKKIPMIILSQRPVWLSRFVFSEASYLQVFGLTDDKDIDVVKRFVKGKARQSVGAEDLPRYWSHYYSVADNTLLTMRPVPTGETILQTIDDKLPKRRKRL